MTLAPSCSPTSGAKSRPRRPTPGTPSSGTCFVGFYRETFGHLRPGEWYRSTTEAFLDQLGKGRVARPSKRGPWQKKKWSQSTIRRTYDTLHHFAGWAHRTADVFGGENPMDGVKPPPEPEAEWKGLEQRDIIRLRNAAMTLRKNPGRGTDTGHRDYAFYYTVEGTGLRADEVCNLDWEQYDGKRFNHVRQKSGHVRKAVAPRNEPKESLAPRRRDRPNQTKPVPVLPFGRF